VNIISVIYRISKSSYIRGKQCLKSLYLHKYFGKDRDPLPEERRLRFKAGHEIGFKAHQLFPGGINLAPPHATKYGAYSKLTQEYIQKSEPVLYEPSFIYEEVLVALDILVFDNGWHAYEVKSSVQISDTYLQDAALQYHVITASGLRLKDFSIIHLTRHHKEISGDEPADELFQITSVKENCINKNEEVRSAIEELRKILNAPGIPKIEMGEQCKKPYDCDFMGFCKRQKALIEAARFKTIDM